MLKRVVGAAVITGGKRASAHSVVIDGQTIRSVDGPEVAMSCAIPRDEYPGALLVPGFVDLQVNGGFGFDLTEDPSSLWELAARLPEHGITAFLPTIITAPLETYARALAVLAAGPPARHRGAIPLGFHFEGPFLAPARRGAHENGHLRAPDLEAISEWTRDRGVRLVTLAPELPGAFALIDRLVAAGVTVSAGHTAADFETSRRAFASGIRYVTHLFNAMPGLHHRQPGILAAALEDPEIVTGIIPDFVHVHPVLLDLVARLKGPDRLNIVTDSMAALAKPPGRYQLGGKEVQVDGLSARLADGTLAGSILRADEALTRTMAATRWPIETAVQCLTSTPTSMLGEDARGRLESSARADLLVLDEGGSVLATYVGGDLVYRAR